MEDTMLVASEAMALLKLSNGRIHTMAQQGMLSSHLATPEEIAALLAAGRIKSVPVTGIRLFTHESVLAAQDRPKPGWPEGKPRAKYQRRTRRTRRRHRQTPIEQVN